MKNVFRVEILIGMITGVSLAFIVSYMFLTPELMSVKEISTMDSDTFKMNMDKYILDEVEKTYRSPVIKEVKKDNAPSTVVRWSVPPTSNLKLKNIIKLYHPFAVIYYVNSDVNGENSKKCEETVYSLDYVFDCMRVRLQGEKLSTITSSKQFGNYKKSVNVKWFGLLPNNVFVYLDNLIEELLHLDFMLPTVIVITDPTSSNNDDGQKIIFSLQFYNLLQNNEKCREVLDGNAFKKNELCEFRLYTMNQPSGTFYDDEKSYKNEITDKMTERLLQYYKTYIKSVKLMNGSPNGEHKEYTWKVIQDDVIFNGDESDQVSVPVKDSKYLHDIEAVKRIIAEKYPTEKVKRMYFHVDESLEKTFMVFVQDEKTGKEYKVIVKSEIKDISFESIKLVKLDRPTATIMLLVANDVEELAEKIANMLKTFDEAAESEKVKHIYDCLVVLVCVYNEENKEEVREKVENTNKLIKEKYNQQKTVIFHFNENTKGKNLDRFVLDGLGTFGSSKAAETILRHLQTRHLNVQLNSVSFALVREGMEVDDGFYQNCLLYSDESQLYLANPFVLYNKELLNRLHKVDRTRFVGDITKTGTFFTSRTQFAVSKPLCGYLADIEAHLSYVTEKKDGERKVGGIVMDDPNVVMDKIAEQELQCKDDDECMELKLKYMLNNQQWGDLYLKEKMT